MAAERVSSLLSMSNSYCRCRFLIIPPVSGTLKGYDQLMNLVLDDVKEVMRGMMSLFQLLKEFI